MEVGGGGEAGVVLFLFPPTVLAGLLLDPVSCSLFPRRALVWMVVTAQGRLGG